jgi:hypothetical protein
VAGGTRESRYLTIATNAAPTKRLDSCFDAENRGKYSCFHTENWAMGG